MEIPLWLLIYYEYLWFSISPRYSVSWCSNSIIYPPYRVKKPCELMPHHKQYISRLLELLKRRVLSTPNHECQYGKIAVELGAKSVVGSPGEPYNWICMWRRVFASVSDACTPFTPFPVHTSQTATINWTAATPIHRAAIAITLWAEVAMHLTTAIYILLFFEEFRKGLTRHCTSASDMDQAGVNWTIGDFADISG